MSAHTHLLASYRDAAANERGAIGGHGAWHQRFRHATIAAGWRVFRRVTCYPRPVTGLRMERNVCTPCE
jgi:hypothetical protein